MVEFALVAPVFFMMFFGVVEFSLITASITTFNFAVKDAARIGSVLGRTEPTVDQQMVNDIVGRTGGLVVAQTQLIEVFLSDAGGSLPAPVNPVENTFSAVPNASCVVCSWAVGSRKDNLLNADYLGVRVTYVYTYLTAFISGASQLQLSAISVQRIEPQSFQGWHAPPSGVPTAFNVPLVSAASRSPSAPVCASAGSRLSLRPGLPDGGGGCPSSPTAWLRPRHPAIWGAPAGSKGDAL